MRPIRPFVIVTLRASALEGTLDLEVPTDVPSGQLAADIVEQINATLKKAALKGAGAQLRCERLNRTLSRRETFAEAGVWSGDIITLSNE